MGLEVDLLDPLAGEVGVELGGRDVGVPEHLLHRAQVAAAGEQVRGEAVAQRVRAHLAVEPRGLGVALDDLVEPLAGQRAAAEVDEQLALRLGPDQLRAVPRAGTASTAAAASRPTGTIRSFEPLPCGRTKPAAQVEVGDLQADGLGGAQPAAVHQLQQRPVAERDRVRSLTPSRAGA